VLYCYLKAQIKPRRRLYLISFGLVAVGLALLANVFLPIAFYQWQSRRLQPRIISPLVGARDVWEANLAGFDSTKPEKWFPRPPALPAWQSRITDYTISIPKLKIKKAVVKINAEDLTKSLFHYPGTALPGQYGNGVIFGHSVLPQFFNPKNYKTIFSTLPNLKKGDEILADFDGVVYRYRVIQMFEVSPDDISVLEQRFDSEYLSLITCVPPGTYLRRLVVKARLVKF